MVVSIVIIYCKHVIRKWLVDLDGAQKMSTKLSLSEFFATAVIIKKCVTWTGF